MTRGRGRSRGRHRGRGRARGGRHDGGPPNGDIEIRLLANEAFRNKLGSLDEHLKDLESDETPGYKIHLEHWSDVEALLGVFRDCTDEDGLAELAFPSNLSKKHRAAVHTMAEATGLGGLATFSRGFGDERYVSVMREGSQPSRDLTDAQAHKAHWLWIFAHDAGHGCSRDEVADMVLMDRIPTVLGELWKVKSAEQKTVISACQAAAAGNVGELQAVLSESPDLVKSGVIDLMSGSALLHAAARGGSADAVKVLLDAGADIEARDGRGWTALRLARKHDHSDAEGVLLRAGARDPEADTWPGGDAAAPVSSALQTSGRGDDKPHEESSKARAEDTEPGGNDAAAPVTSEGQMDDDTQPQQDAAPASDNHVSPETGDAAVPTSSSENANSSSGDQPQQGNAVATQVAQHDQEQVDTCASEHGSMQSGANASSTGDSRPILPAAQDTDDGSSHQPAGDSAGAHEQRPGPSSKTDESGREEDHEDAEGQHVSVAPQAADQQQRDADAQEGPAAREHGMETRDAEPLAESEPPLEAVEGKPDTEVMVSDGAGVAVEAEIQEVAQQTHEELSGHADDSKKGREPEDGPPAASQDAKRTVTADDTDAPSSVQPAQSDDDAGDNHAPAGEQGEPDAVQQSEAELSRLDRIDGPEEPMTEAAAKIADAEVGLDGSVSAGASETYAAEDAAHSQHAEPPREAASAEEANEAEVAATELTFAHASVARAQGDGPRDSFEFKPPVGPGSSGTMYPGFPLGVPKSESLQVLPPTSNAASSDTNDADSTNDAESPATITPAIASFGSAADLVSIDSAVAEKSEPPATLLASVGGDSALPAAIEAGKSSSAETVKPAVSADRPTTAARSGFGASPVLPPQPIPRKASRLRSTEISPMPQLDAQLSTDDEGEGTFADWLPQPVADWAHWAYENPSTLVYYGFGAATVGATLVLLMGGRRRR